MKVLLATLLFYISIATYAQISVASFERRENDLDARVNYPIKDQNGDVCALLKIATTQTGFVFEGGQLGIMKTEKKTGEYWVYIPYGSKRITIKHDQLGNLYDYTFPESIDKSTVYLMKLTTGKVTTIVEEPEILTEWVIIESTPIDAQVYIDDKPVGKTPFSGEYIMGQHQYRVELPMYHSDAGLFTLSTTSGRQKVSINLKPNFGSISVNSLPESGADVLLNGKPTGQKTPCILTEISSGPNTISCKKEMYYDNYVEVLVEDSKTVQADLIMKPAYGELNITTNPESDIFLNGTKVGFSTFSVRKPSGFYTIEARKDKHTPDSKKIEVTDGQIIPVSLSPVPQYGMLKLSSSPPEAEIFLNGQSMGTTPITLKQILVGDYNLELKKTGYSIFYKQITISHNETTEITETLQNGLQVTITSDPAGAIIEIDGTNAGTTPYSGNLSFASHSIKLTNNTKIVNETITVSQGGKTSWSFDLSEAKNFTETVSGVAIEMVSIKGGTFTMGSPTSEVSRGDDETQHQVTVSDFYMGKYEVTFEQYDAFCTATGRTQPSDDGWGRGKLPVINVSWNDANAYCEWLSKQTGKAYRLATEAEWEYSCRAGTTTPFSTGNNLSTSQANYNGNYPYNNNAKGEYRQMPLPVGSFSANAYGLYDMHGNVWEWCSDWKGDYHMDSQTNPMGATTGSWRMRRGGSWNELGQDSRSANRNGNGSDYSHYSLGFRVVVSPE